jgi:predicted transcriptional regulator
VGRGASFEDVADILGNSPAIVRKHYAKWSPERQARIDELMERVHSVGTNWAQTEKRAVIQ